ncbi:MAG TPA: alpha/beta hydrolase fold domain-containing protein [Acidimicrobiales bacterium]|nr:alpha/beta hydrolase fold domain-containing protein [Acidimicrobiales bacterium]
MNSEKPGRETRTGQAHPNETGAGKTGAGQTGAGKTGAGKTGAGKSGTGKTDAGKTGAGKASARKTAAPTTSTVKTTGEAEGSAVREPRTDRGPSGFDPAPPPWPLRPPGWRGRRTLGLYSRSVPRANERWPLITRGLSGLLRHPSIVLRLLGGAEPVERDGRVLNPGLQALVAVANRFGGTTDGSPDPERFDVSIARSQLRRSARVVMPVRTDVYASGRVIPGPENAPPVGIRLYRRFGSGLGAGARGPGLPAIVYFHGGGWVSGDLDTHDPLCRILALASGCLVVAVDYRLAPEDPFPAAVDDALAAYCWVHQHHDELGIADGQVGVMGDSSGGNLAAVVAQLARAGTGRAPAPPPIAQGLVYPVVDARLGSESMRSLADGFLLTRAAMEFYRGQYLPDRSLWESPMASPVLAPDLGGLAPALVVTAGFDPLRDDGAAYAQALQRAGVVVEHRRYEDQIHGFMHLGIVADSLALATEVCESMGRLMRHSSRLEDAGWAEAEPSRSGPRGTARRGR